METKNLIQLSEKLLLAVKLQHSTTELVAELSLLTSSQLENELISDANKKAFWINVYNAFYQLLSKNGFINPDIFTKKLIRIAKVDWSLDDIEHGILRKYRYKYGLGYLPRWFTADHIKKMSVSKIDYRIHFALNCGAKSCPPIAIYSDENIDAQLEMAQLSFLESETVQDNEKKEIRVSRILLWFLGDFGGKKGIRKIVEEKLQMETKGYKLTFNAYSWETLLDNYRGDNLSSS